MTEGPKRMMIESLRRVLQRLRYPIEVMLVCVGWYAAKILSWIFSAELPKSRLPAWVCVTAGFLAKNSTMAAKRSSA